MVGKALGQSQALQKQNQKNLGRNSIGNSCLPPSCVDTGFHLMVPVPFGVITWKSSACHYCICKKHLLGWLLFP